VSYARTKNISETDSPWKKHNLPHFQLISPRQQGLYPPKRQEDILHIVELYQRDPNNFYIVLENYYYYY
jgi:hypothetical protein